MGVNPHRGALSGVAGVCDGDLRPLGSAHSMSGTCTLTARPALTQ